MGLRAPAATVEAHYAVFRTKPSQASTVFNVGRYIDTIVRTTDGLKFASRLCVYDSEMPRSQKFAVEPST